MALDDDWVTLNQMIKYLKYGFGDLFVLVTLLIVGGVILTVVDAENKKIPSRGLAIPPL